jgi:ubiquinone/menaquinone biosynthesis C-methylase UbiE
MKLEPAQIARFEEFLETIGSQTYPEVPSGQHDQISAQMVERVWSQCAMPPNAKVLDVGCGQGVALKLFAAKGCEAIGVTLNKTDVDVCQALGYNVLQMDQSFLEFPDASFDVLWCRHCLEHSIYPYFTLSGFHRVLKPGGWLYIEVPAPDTSCAHQTNGNHYSVLGKSMLGNLIERSGFRITDILDITFTVPAGPDMYWAFIQQRI